MQQVRTILAVVLSMLVFFVYYTFISPPVAPSPRPKQPEATISTQTATNPQLADNQVKSQATEVALFPQVLQSSKDDQILENDSVKLVLSSKGAQIKDVYLKKYPKGDESKHEVVNLVDSGSGLMGMTYSSNLNDFDVDYLLDATQSNNTTKVFSATVGDLEIKKIYQFDSHSVYGFKLDWVVKNKSSQILNLEPKVWMTRQQKENPDSSWLSFLAGPPDVLHPVAYIDKKIVTELDPAKIGTFGTKMGSIDWAGFGDRYFMTSFISLSPTGNSAVSFLSADAKKLFSTFTYGQLVMNPGEEISRSVSLYLGPKMRSELQTFGVALEKSVDYGWFSFVAIPLLWMLVMFEKFVGNWGLAIILLTFVVKLILHPINKKSMESMKAMQKLQPRMKEIQEKYKGDREKLNIEMMTMFKSHKVNPMGGCLPMLLQMPIYIALYKVLWNAIELYKAPFFGIYKDLSAPDPYFIGPILLGILFYLQQKFTPTSASMDPAQQKIMQFMPIMFTAFMVFLPAGLIMYICVNTFMSVVQQYMMHRDLGFRDLFRSLVKK